MKKAVTLLTLLVFCTGLFPLQALATDTTTDKATPVTLIVELEKPPLLAQASNQSVGAKAYLESDNAATAESQLRTEQTKVLHAIDDLCHEQTSNIRTNTHKGADKDKPLEPRYTYTHALNGFAIQVDPRFKDAIASLDGVKRVTESHPVKLIAPVDATASRSTSTTDLNGMHTDALHTQNIRGQGQVVAVIDTELDTHHDMFAGEVAQASLSKDTVSALLKSDRLNISATTPITDVYRSSKLPFVYNYMDETAEPISDRSHGSHVSGIAVGRNGTTMDGKPLNGIAPEAQLVFFGIDGYNGMGSDDVLLAAIDDASKLGADVINMSLTAYFSESQSLYKEILDNTRRADILLSVAAGNSGRISFTDSPNPNQTDFYTIAPPANAAQSFAVAACNVSEVALPSSILTIEGSQQTIPYLSCGLLPLQETYIETIYCREGNENDFEGINCNNKIAVIEEGQAPLEKRLLLALQSGAFGVIVINNNDQLDNDNIASLDTFPCLLLVSAQDGEFLRKDGIRIKTIKNTDGVQRLPMRPENMASFTSWGMSADLTLKPDITAPGANIYSAMPDNKYHTYSGTSMAAPHIAGATALMRQYIDTHPQYYTAIHKQADKTALIENLMMSTATILTQEDGVPHSPRQQGAGLINLQAATTTPAILLGENGKTKISLGHNLSNHITFDCEAQNLTDTDVTYDKISLTVLGETLSDDGSPNGMQTLPTSAIHLPESVTVPGGGNTTINADVQIDHQAIKDLSNLFQNGFFIDGYLTCADSSGKVPAIHLPFSGFYGDWLESPALDQPFYNSDSVRKLTGLVSLDERNSIQTQFYFLGTNHYMSKKTDEIENLVGDSNLVAYSPNKDGLFDTLLIGLAPLRETTQFEITIRDQKGHTVDEQKIDTIAYKEGINLLSLSQEKLATLPEGNYTLDLTGAFNMDGSKKEHLSFPFAVDLQAPTISQWHVDHSGGKTYLSFEARDNRSIMGAIAEVRSPQTNQYNCLDKADTQYWASPEKGSFIFDITGKKPENLKITLLDHAGNMTQCFGKNGSPFSDVPANAWYTESIQYVKDHGIMNGTDNTTFSPNMPLNRAMMAAVLYNMEQQPQTDKNNHFSDVTNDKWYSEAVNWAASNHIVSGMPNGTYAPNQALTREQMASILYRYAKYKGIDTDQRANLDIYTDKKTISPWAKDVVAWAVAEKLITGTSTDTLQPKATATRAQVAAVLMNYSKHIAK